PARPEHPPSSPTRRSSDLRFRPTHDEASLARRLQTTTELARYGEIVDRPAAYAVEHAGTLQARLLHPQVHLPQEVGEGARQPHTDRKSTRLNSSHVKISYA